MGDFAAVALRMPPGVEPDGEATVALFEATVDTQKFEDLVGVFGQMDENHPTVPHWYLPWFGVDCNVQGQGFGSRLMRPCLDIVDQEHLPAYLDSTNPSNVAFYQRHGFEVTGQWRSGDSPPIISMIRQPH
ncbi:MAG TPA: GNAT family N-acetyltransferase [Actinomycetes bacterium]